MTRPAKGSPSKGPPSKGPVPLDQQLCYAIYSAGMAIQRAYKPLLDELGLTYSQYLVLNVLWAQDNRTVGQIAALLALESSTLTPLLKRLEAAGLVSRARNPKNERQVVVSLTDAGRDIEAKSDCLSDTLLEASGQTPAELGALNADIRKLRDAVYASLGTWGGAEE